ncbi:hypothetical protein FQN60_014652, partial [Etheostoma spectabile]
MKSSTDISMKNLTYNWCMDRLGGGYMWAGATLSSRTPDWTNQTLPMLPEPDTGTPTSVPGRWASSAPPGPPAAAGPTPPLSSDRDWLPRAAGWTAAGTETGLRTEMGH